MLVFFLYLCIPLIVEYKTNTVWKPSSVFIMYYYSVIIFMFYFQSVQKNAIKSLYQDKSKFSIIDISIGVFSLAGIILGIFTVLALKL
jgi:hypothetical protein